MVAAGFADKCLLNILFFSDRPLPRLPTFKRSNRPGLPPRIAQVVLCTEVGLSHCTVSYKDVTV